MMATTPKASMREILAATRRPLVLAVGGGNDSVSSLMLQRQLQADYGYAPSEVTIAAMLPDCLDYHGTEPMNVHPLLCRIGRDSSRSVQGRSTSKFPERMLAEGKDGFPGLPIKEVMGMSMREGSTGLARALGALAGSGAFDSILAIDVGGDFIATPENKHVLSPMMDAYMANALRSLEPTLPIPIVYGVFGLGTDGETPPALLHAALERLSGLSMGRLEMESIADVSKFHREVVEPSRYSRTADFTLLEISRQGHPNPAMFRARFHAKSSKSDKARIYFSEFNQYFDPSFYGAYALFDSLRGVDNPYELSCNNGIEWLMGVHAKFDKPNHELCGQAYMDAGAVLGRPELSGLSLLVGTPSHLFSERDQAQILGDTISALCNGLYSAAIVHNEPQAAVMARSAGLVLEELSPELCLIGSAPEANLLAKGILKN